MAISFITFVNWFLEKDTESEGELDEDGEKNEGSDDGENGGSADNQNEELDNGENGGGSEDEENGGGSEDEEKGPVDEENGGSGTEVKDKPEEHPKKRKLLDLIKNHSPEKNTISQMANYEESSMHRSISAPTASKDLSQLRQKILNVDPNKLDRFKMEITGLCCPHQCTHFFQSRDLQLRDLTLIPTCSSTLEEDGSIMKLYKLFFDDKGRYPCETAASGLFGIGRTRHFNIKQYAKAGKVIRTKGVRKSPPKNKMSEEWAAKLIEYCDIMLLRNPGAKGGEYCLPTLVSSFDGFFDLFKLAEPDFPHCSKTFRKFVQSKYSIQSSEGTSCVCEVCTKHVSTLTEFHKKLTKLKKCQPLSLMELGTSDGNGTLTDPPAAPNVNIISIQRQLKNEKTALEQHKEHFVREFRYYREQVAIAKNPQHHTLLLSIDFKTGNAFPFFRNSTQNSVLSLRPMCNFLGIVNESTSPAQCQIFIYDNEVGGTSWIHITSALEYYFTNKMQGNVQYDKLIMRFDNCTGQNKNQFMLGWAANSVLTGRFSEVVLGFLVVGHTKFSPDRFFGLIARKLRRVDGCSLLQISEHINLLTNVKC